MNRARRLLTLGAALAISSSGLAVPVASADTAPTTLLLTEYVSGSGSNTALEIHNGTGAAVDLGAGGYRIAVRYGGSPTQGINLPLTGVIAAGDSYVIGSVSSSTSPLLPYLDRRYASAYWDGDDVIILESSAGVVDSFGQMGVDPGTEWPGGGAGDTLRRDDTVCAGDTVVDDAFDASTQWTVFPLDTFDGLGSHVLDCDGDDGSGDDGSGDDGDPFADLRALLDELVEDGEVAPQLHRTFHARIDRIEQFRAAGKSDAAAAQLEAFHRQLDGVTPRHVTVAAAALLHETADELA